ncbi:oligosaccharide flippase family protein [Mycolicibacterium smegmatis]|uniref:lipopolysaccharide biosynthesis protein n=1 Tax=Mycolicibacterium smegmatis TaxID=1772 RepID=UPI0005D96207|nr:oligosaccharide flippase family protein [Mycolicibacterium smegmatis]MDF1901738.1 oligosaccharide flippase family protein [Mycolicibacterium smegmatis]MDF1908082.1 oligosaccharide flippase family protein [Mycolicibacterium smegmatis]MDF1920594.1 oligosaccharide flippase family protein [Mycolicibacterium smegmatis]MDF1926537.1 oligosaccharide flippase family protein [Mycolicibacterium smegmatis]UAK57388.1 oligosaccharide flippase family protein [Mycolicibacterium smegmatis]
MTTDQGRLAPEERRSLVLGPLYRILGTPVVALLGLLNTAIIVRETGEAVFGLVSLIATVTLLFPFADLGIGATAINAAAMLGGKDHDEAVDVIRRAYRVLFLVAGTLIAIALGVMVLDGWRAAIGFASGPEDRWAITVAVCIFALTIPAGLGPRILVGIDRNPMATLVLMSCPAFGLGLTLVLRGMGASGIWYAISALGGLLIGQLVGTVLALRLSGLGADVFSSVSSSRAGTRLLAGSMWLFLVGVGIPIGSQGGRVLLAHLSTPEELSRYALMAQIYAIGWQILSTAALAYWPIFVKRRSVVDATIRMWWQLTVALAVVGIVAMVLLGLLGPWAASVLSDGEIDVSAWLALAFGAVLVGQAVHFASSVLLTRSNEARWQALWTLTMAAVSIGLGCLVVARFGAVGVVFASALAILTAQVLPDLLWVPRLVRRRSPVG